ncbi:regulation of nuclear pre-mRNA domain-containing protein 1B-like [Quillaja saponaria]|uniref:Regulation of nuclear pre-mRNA domain-containing protein 1B-like n=1 Tax=Quillaja saponaria TaxID=32244 RepID=A0AAD7VHZ4_QUISA|nr:regulation of nuclear pre-mRNA domain-containing protein 1B-like [Quillaja saponaria]
MSNDVYDGQILADKLSKLNNSQQSIESLSHWCISHRKKVKEIVETWDKSFNSSQKDQCVSFLYLANDILQNSRRKGSEFVNEFWKVLPAALKHVYQNGDENGKKAVTRLVGIWEERKVFGSRGQGLKDKLMAKSTVPVSASNGKSSNHIKIVKRDAHSVRIKLATGGLTEKILTAFQSVLDEHHNEDAALNKCNGAVSNVGKIMEDVESALAQGNQLGSTLVNDLQEQEKELQQCIAKLENGEATRAALLSLLKEALHEQEARQELIHAQLQGLQAARGNIEQASNMRKRLMIAPVPGHPTATSTQIAEATRMLEQNLPSDPKNSTASQPPLTQPVISMASVKTTEEKNRAVAAAVAAKLAASTSSAQMLTSVLSSLVAEEAASMNGSLKSTGFTSGLPTFTLEKRQKLDKPMPVSDVSSSDTGSASYFTPLQQTPMTNMPPAPSTSLQSTSQAHQIQAAFAPPPASPSLLPPPHSSANPPSNQYVHSSGLMVGSVPYAFGANNLPPPPPMHPHVAMGLSRPSAQPPQQPQAAQQQHQSQQQQQPTTGGYYRPPIIGFYGQNHPTPPPVPRQ